MTIKSRIEKIESGIDMSMLSPQQVTSIDVTRLTDQQIHSLPILYLSDEQLGMIGVHRLSDRQLNEFLSAMPPEERAWLKSLSDDELRRMIEDPAALDEIVSRAPWYQATGDSIN